MRNHRKFRLRKVIEVNNRQIWSFSSSKYWYAFSALPPLLQSYCVRRNHNGLGLNPKSSSELPQT